MLPELPLQEAASRRVGLRLLVGAGLALGAVLRDGAITAAGGGGKRIARVARRYKGSRYRWGGNTPRGFDCSGFTQYVVREAIKLELSQALPDQWRSGRRVGKGKWRAGDLVFFGNTYKKGLSHVGIYLERGQFIHAQNEQTGVVITDIESDYYASRYRGARRLA